MPIVLIVDDSEVDRKLMGGILSQDLDWLVSYAENGRSALDTMRTATPDVVVTDLKMPDMDGLQLVAAVRDQFQNVPVILVTGQGSEKLASQALRHGAASYVPKSQLADELLETVRQVVALTKSDRDLERLLRRSTNIRHKFSLSNEPELFAIYIDFVTQTLQRMAFGDATKRMHIAVALEEALLNAMYHGNLELPAERLVSVRQELHETGNCALIEDRNSEPPYHERSILVGFDVTPDRVQLVVRDQGPGFDIKSVPERQDIARLTEGPQRGLVLIQNFMDEVSFNDTGNEIHMMSKRPE